ncbi:hypothetical protein [Pseudonocardia charpentierae]|uniref:Uncharacterized protein n=1 Tax=Pseudonocardia charpentierae TaxID=3075545 RepID=A0ABU2NI09_9PSEU|nr:hypothetical protein [Pseudonocardia sp. DSM 45834]MDT0353335.1 hypothetical protein [Pseudonocardia sp. DSM 45834]
MEQREHPPVERGAGAGERRTAGAARAGAAAVGEVIDLLAAGAGATELAAAIDRAAQAARPLVGWPTYEAMTRLLHTTRRCARHRAGSHTSQVCADLAEASRSLQEALDFDGFLPGYAHPGPVEAALTRGDAARGVPSPTPLQPPSECR